MDHFNNWKEQKINKPYKNKLKNAGEFIGFICGWLVIYSGVSLLFYKLGIVSLPIYLTGLPILVVLISLLTLRKSKK